MFQSTHSLRSATPLSPMMEPQEKVSIHALLAECDRYEQGDPRTTWCFNPRTPCGVRQCWNSNHYRCFKFQSTHSLRSATFIQKSWSKIPVVSIHALLAECDRPLSQELFHKISFNPRTPCGVRLLLFVKFSSRYLVSIHALLAECDDEYFLR